MSTTVGAQNLTAFRHRLTQILEQFGSVAALSRAVGVSDNAIYKWLSGRGQPSLANLIGLARAGSVSVEWLATGRVAASSAESKLEGNAGEYVFLPKYIVEGPATEGFPITSEQVVNYLAFNADWVRNRLQAHSKNLLLIEAVGDSMVPTFSDSDLLLVDLGEPQFKHDGIYVLRRDNDLSIRRIQRQPDGNLLIRSDNRVYDPYIVRSDALRVIGRVIWAGRRL